MPKNLQPGKEISGSIALCLTFYSYLLHQQLSQMQELCQELQQLVIKQSEGLRPEATDSDLCERLIMKVLQGINLM